MRLERLVLPALVVVFLFRGCFSDPSPSSSSGSSQYPLQGQEASDAPVGTDLKADGTPDAKVEVLTTALLERVLSFNVIDNTYTAVWWVILTWKDARAGELVAATTAAVLMGTAGCGRPCDSNGLPSAGCCDKIWMPHVELPNMILYDQDQLVRYRINANATSGTVTWSTRLVGTWYTPLDFRAYPFDHQHLLMEMSIADSQAAVAGLRWEHVAKLNNTAHTKGSDLSGWRVKWGKAKVYDSRACMARYNVTTPRYTVAPGDPSVPLLPALYQSLRLGDRFFASNAGRGTSSPGGCGDYPTVYDEGRALYGPIVLVADIMVKRVASYYIITNLLPVLIISIVTFVVYYMPCNALNDRLMVSMTLFLSLTAMQFVFDFPPANYLNALQQAVLIAYIMMLLACMESMLVNWIVALPQNRKNKRACLSKYNTLLRRTAGLFTRGLFGKGPHSWSLPSSLAAAAVSESTSAADTAAHSHAHRYPQMAAAAASGNAPAPPAPGCPGAPAARAFAAGGRAGSARVGTRKRSNVGPSVSRRRAAASAPGGAPGTGESSCATSGGGASVATDAAGEQPCSCVVGAAQAHLDVQEVQEESAIGVSLLGRPHGPPEAPPHWPDADLVRTPVPPQAPAPAHYSCPAAPPPLAAASSDPPSPYGCGMSEPSSIKAPHRSGRVACFPTAALLARLLGWVSKLLHAPRRFYQHCKEDPEFAWFVAVRIDKWFCVVSLILYVVVIGVLVWVQTLVGDHKLMLGDAPGNM